MNSVGVFNLGKNGRLGNQLFQIFSAWGYAKKYDYSLHFNHVPILDYLDIEYSETWFESKRSHSDKNSLKYETIPHYDYIVLNGYFQSPFYWDNFINEFPNVLKWKNAGKRKGEQILGNDKKNCFIHVRRGDYVRVSSLLLSPEYYYDAIERIIETEKDVNFHVFSDDIEYCENIFKDYDFIYHKYNSDIQDVVLMSLCDYGIMSNSSFSWWGGYMEKKKLCIYPQHWFNKTELDTRDICPEYLKWEGIWNSRYNGK